MKKFTAITLATLGILSLAGCTDYEPEARFPSNENCILVSDDFGDREVCGVRTGYYNGYPTYYDPYFSSWIWAGPGGGYFVGGVFYTGYIAGWHARYGAGYYHPHGYFGGRYHYGFRGGYHGGGEFHGGGRGGHR